MVGVFAGFACPPPPPTCLAVTTELQSYLPGSCMACRSVLLCSVPTDHACPFPHPPRPQGQLRKKDALIDKLRAQLTRAEAKYRARLDAVHSPGGCFLPPEQAAAGPGGDSIGLVATV